MQNYNIALQSNNFDLQSILNTINELPEAGSGGEQATPEISVNSTNGLITATAGTKSSTYQMAFQPAKTITPGTASQIAVSSGYYTGGNITVAGDANLVAGNIKSGVSIFGVSGTLEEGGGSGEQIEWSANEDAMITRTLSQYFNDRVTYIGSSAFVACTSLTTISFPACEIIYDNAFAACNKLTTINFPVCRTVYSKAFNACMKLTSISFPVCRNIYFYAFVGCTSLTSINFPVCTNIYSGAFSGCTSLTSVSLPACTFLQNNVFASCENLTSISLPACKAIESSAFKNCLNLKSFYLTGSNLCTLSNSNAFSVTPFTGYSYSFSGTPHIYVPASLVSAYQSATNWAYFSSYFSSIESLGPILITFTIDGTEYQAEDRMTWGEWIESEYNTTTVNFTFDENNKIITPEGHFLIESLGGNSYLMMFNNTLIKDGAVYILFN